MSSCASFRTLLAVFFVVLTFSTQFDISSGHQEDEDFAFDVTSSSDDFEVEIDGGLRSPAVGSDEGLWGGKKEVTAVVGKAFHLIVPKDSFGADVQSYETKQLGGKPLPPWLLFDKTGGIFWGVPLPEDASDIDKTSSPLKLYVKAIGSDKNTTEELVINVISTENPPNFFKPGMETCPKNEDVTVLTLLIDRGIRAIKPKQRVIAINNVAKFFGLPISAFTLRPQLEKDDITTDSSVVIAGPGNLQARSSKQSSKLEVPVGCDGRLWTATTPIVLQLKQQAKDGTITEVMGGLPLIGWRVKTETKPIISSQVERKKRQADDYGSGDYEDDYYEENYEDEQYDDEDGGGRRGGASSPKITTIKPSITKSTVKSTTSTTTLRPSSTSSGGLRTSTHPHRHHHGEPKITEEEEELEEDDEQYDGEFSVPAPREDHHPYENSSPRGRTPTEEMENEDDEEEDYEDEDEESDMSVTIPIGPEFRPTTPASLVPPTTTPTTSAATTTSTATPSRSTTTSSTTSTSTSTTAGRSAVNSTTARTTTETLLPLATTTTIKYGEIDADREIIIDTLDTTTRRTTTTTQSTSRAIPVESTTKVDKTDEYDYDYDYGPDVENPDDEDPLESKTIVPDLTARVDKHKKPSEIPDEEESVTELPTFVTSTTTTTTARATTKDVVSPMVPRFEEDPALVPTTTTARSSTSTLGTTVAIGEDEMLTSSVIVEDSESPLVEVSFVATSSSSEAPPTTTISSTTGAGTTPFKTPQFYFTTLPASNTTARATATTPTVMIGSTLPEENTDQTDSLEDSLKTTTVKMATGSSTYFSSHHPSNHDVIFTTPKTTTVRDVTDFYTETIEYGTKNFEPYIENRIQQMSVIAGKIFRFVVPKNTFKDFEDEYDLSLQFLSVKNETIDRDHWCQFNPARREIYGLPLEDDVSKWEYVLRATDKEGASVDEHITIQVQQHKSQRVVNHEFWLTLRIEKQQEFPHYVDWCLKILRALGYIYRSNMSEITVRQVDYGSSNGDPVVFAWTNDSIPTNHCPSAEIDQRYKILTANDRGDPSRELSLALAPQIRVKKVEKRLMGVCGETQTPLVTPPTNFPPFLRNPVDHINATVGELLVFRVPDDTFYDPEDTDTRTLNITLLTADRQPLKPNHWLQFDSKNREFYGIPRKIGRSEYQLVCTDSAGLPATDSLEIVVYPAPKKNYTVEFSMTLMTPYDQFVNNSGLQKKFVEKLQRLFGDRNASLMHFNPFRQKDDTTVITWYNKSLSTQGCAQDEIDKLESILRNNDRSISSRVHSIMEPDFPVSIIKVLPLNDCKSSSKAAGGPSAGSKPPPRVIDAIAPPVGGYPPNKMAPKPPVHMPPDQDRGGRGRANEDSYNTNNKISYGPDATEFDVNSGEDQQSHQQQYLMTFIIPAIIIALMLFLAAIAACVLYRRRRSGKMNVEEDGRTSYGNKGIPVIFQEELEEKPESGTKTPVILQDEKPPLAPPEYSKSGASLKQLSGGGMPPSAPPSTGGTAMEDTAEPYQPPPPFARSQESANGGGRHAPRPKATPTYRKPPPYVPP